MRETERQKRWAAGSITAYLCLVLILMLSLISGTIASVRNAHARVMTACAMEQGLYSLFAGYDRTLLGQYELFFYNGGDKSGVWKPETMSRKVAETAGEVLSPTASADRLQKFISAAIVLRQTRREVLSPVRSVRQ